MSASLAGGCHCGNVHYRLVWPGDPAAIPARACACAFCTRHGAVWIAHPDAVLEVSIADSALVSRYSFATETAVFHLCARCGVVTVATSLIGGRERAVVNATTLAQAPGLRLERSVVDFANESTEARLARRERAWIRRVGLVLGRGSA